MNILDGIVLVIAAFFLVRGVMVGLVRQLAFFLALLLGYLLAGAYHPVADRLLDSLVANGGLRFLLAYLLTFVVVYLAVMLLGVGLRKVMQVSFLGWFDRLLGGALGLAKAGFLAVFLYMMLALFLAGDSPLFTGSLAAPWLHRGAEALTRVMRDPELRRSFIPQPPAIPQVLAAPQTMVPPAQPRR